jgi:hypothetical protein
MPRIFITKHEKGRDQLWADPGLILKGLLDYFLFGLTAPAPVPGDHLRQIGTCRLPLAIQEKSRFTYSQILFINTTQGHGEKVGL